MKSLIKSILIVLTCFSFLYGCTKPEMRDIPASEESDILILEDSWYSSKEEVAEYIRIYDQLPSNYITKEEARSLGWNSSEGNLWDVAEGMSIGGDVFGNREKLLPEKEGRIWIECDIDYQGGYRNEKRLVFSNDGLFYYTEDHYESFVQIEGE